MGTNRPHSCHRDWGSLHNSCPTLISALIMSSPFLGMQRVKWPLPRLQEPRAQLSIYC